MPRKVREGILFISFLTLCVVLSSWFLHLPLQVGRLSISFIRSVEKDISHRDFVFVCVCLCVCVRVCMCLCVVCCVCACVCVYCSHNYFLFYFFICTPSTTKSFIIFVFILSVIFILFSLFILPSRML